MTRVDVLDGIDIVVLVWVRFEEEKSIMSWLSGREVLGGKGEGLLRSNPRASGQDVQRDPLTQEDLAHWAANDCTYCDRFDRFPLFDIPLNPDRQIQVRYGFSGLSIYIGFDGRKRIELIKKNGGWLIRAT